MVGVIVISIIVFCFALLFWYIRAQQKRKAKIDLHGVATIGAVVRKTTATSRYGTSSYGIVFEFEHDCEVFVKKTWVLDKRDYDNAVVGMTYEVKYLPNRPKTAIIFTDRPMGKRADLQDDNSQQKKKFINRKRNRILFAVSMVVAFVLLFWLGKVERETRANIELYGIETVGTVIHKFRSDGSYSVRFEYEHNGEIFWRTPNASREFENAIVGMQYVVKFLPNNPKKARIFIDKPVIKNSPQQQNNNKITTK